MYTNSTLSLLGALGLAACANGSSYVPAVTSNAVVANVQAIDYPMPPEAPAGDIRLATLGVVEVHPLDAPTGTAKAIHVRMVATNAGPTPWTIDAREQRITLAGAAPIHAGGAITGQGAEPPIVEIAAGGKGAIDLIFVLPEEFQRASKRPEFDVLWTVHTGTRTVELRTPFDRLSMSSYYSDDWSTPGEWGGSSSPSR